MHRPSRPEVLDLQSNEMGSGMRDRSRSVSSTDNPLSSSCSTISLTTNPLVNVSPPPAYIASSAATRLVTNDHEVFFQSLHDDGILGAEPPVMWVTEPALKLVNEFLDFLLYTFIATAKSTSLAALRPAVAEVLRQRLAKEAVEGADQELRSYIGADAGSDTVIDPEAAASSREWDLEWAWRKARVQCMVYSSLGDLEEDDEAFYSEQNLDAGVGGDHSRQTTDPVVITAAVAIWLTSILEFIGEKTLLVAGHATISRYSVQRIAAAATNGSTLTNSNADVTFPERPMVEDHDAEKVALNPSLGRMWRQWRKKLRGGRGSISLPAREVSSQLQASERQGNSTVQVDRNTVQFNLAALPFFVPLPQSNIAQASTTASTSLPAHENSADGPLSPIAESSTPHISVTVPSSNGVNLQELSKITVHPNVVSDKRRPQSLIYLPLTNVSPFTLAPLLENVKKHRSLPELKRGDFADPSTEEPLANEQSPAALPTASAFSGTVEQIHLHLQSLATSPTSMSQHSQHVQGPIELDAKKESCSPPNSPNEILGSAPEDGPEDAATELNASPSLQTSTQCVDQQPLDTVCSAAGGGDVSPVHTPVGVTPETRDLSPKPNTESVLSVSPINNSALSPHKTPLRTGFADDVDSDKDISQGATSLKPTTNNLEEIKRSSHIKTPSSSSKHSQLSDRKMGQLTLVQTSGSSHSGGAGGVRVFTPPTTPDRARRSSSFSKLQRPTHTSGSTSSQTSTKLKNLLPWQSDAGKHTKLAESDTESRSSLHSDRLTTLDDKERSFEELISGGGTIHCTITPDPIRNMEINKVSKTKTSELADFFRNTGPDGRARSSSNSKTGTTVSNITRTVTNTSLQRPGTSRLVDGPEQTALAPSPQLDGKLSSPPRTLDTVSRNHEFPTMSSAKVTGISGSPGSGIDLLPAVVRQNAPESPNSAAHTRSRLLAREASGSTGSDTTSALADFFRNTNPPTDGDAGGNRRISRSVAPFRNTMDSTQFEPTDEANDVISDDARITSSNFGITPNPHESYQSSFNSSTALLRSSSRGKRDFGGPASTYAMSSDGPQIKRKQVRNKDPYAIDYDDEDDYNDDGFDSLDLVLPKKRNEESLMDFLNSTPPPPPQPTVPFETNLKTVQKKHSAVSLMNRFGRSHRKNSISVSEQSVSHQSPAAPVKYVPLRVESNYMRQDSEPTYGQRLPSLDNMRNNSASKYAMPRNTGPIYRPTEARGGKVDASGTDSLADFLKNTGPPEQRLQHLPAKEESSKSVFKKMGFSRSKKVSGMI